MSPISFSVVVPMFRTERYLSGLFSSLENQEPGDYTLECIFIDDGSPDNSGDLAREWLKRSGRQGHVVRQENMGVSEARNRGIDEAIGDWITFPDSDDYLNRTFFTAAAALIQNSPAEMVLVSANVMRYDEETQCVENSHPLRFKFSDGNRIADLNDEPLNIQSQAASALFRRQLIVEYGIRFIPKLQVAEDALFTSTYLLRAPVPLVAFAADSIYYYRHRATGDSAVNTFKFNPDFYFGRFERGYLPLFTLAAELGDVPIWLQMVFLYDLRWYFPRELSVAKKASHLSGDEKQQTLKLVSQVLEYVSRGSVLSYDVTEVAPEIRALWLALKGEELPDRGRARIGRITKGVVEVRYLCTERQPRAQVISDQGALSPLAEKTRTLDFFGQRKLFERIVLVKAASGLGLEVENRNLPLERGNYSFVPERLSLRRIGVDGSGGRISEWIPVAGVPIIKSISSWLGAEVACWSRGLVKDPILSDAGAKLRRRRYSKWLQAIAQSPTMIARYKNAWLLMDRIGAANDNAEYLYQYLSEAEPDRNIWFVIQKKSADWKRLKDAGFRLIPYRSQAHKVALMNARVVASSHLDEEIVTPIPDAFYKGTRPWRYVYLQHGVLQHNLSAWFNNKPIDLLTTASNDEHESIVGELTDYRLTDHSVKLTGFPRHDALRSLAETRPWEARNIILVAPTWRNELFAAKEHHSAARVLKNDFRQSRYWRAWLEFLGSKELEQLQRGQGARILFLPHPNLRTQLDASDLPPNVELISHVTNLHELLASAKVTVTDYSSIFFDAALANSRVVYYQFDREDYLNGAHIYTPGYWSYEGHGLGPACSEPNAAAASVVRAFSAEGGWPPVYEERLEASFQHVDGESARRIVGEIDHLLTGVNTLE